MHCALNGMENIFQFFRFGGQVKELIPYFQAKF